VSDCDLVKGSIKITKAVVLSRKKNRTKTNQDREIDLCPCPLEVLRQQLVLREQMVTAGKINHECVFFTESGEPFPNCVPAVQSVAAGLEDPSYPLSQTVQQSSLVH
jgi:hypothetical protein